jgi:primosomal protein N' (replication factor Y)
VLENNYHDFYTKEIMLRQQNQYPPFSRIALIEFKNDDYQKARHAANDFHKRLIKYGDKIQILPPNEAVIARIKGIYRYQILVKSLKRFDPGGKILRNAILDAYAEHNQRSRFSDVKIYFDIDPQSVM